MAAIYHIFKYLKVISSDLGSVHVFFWNLKAYTLGVSLQLSFKLLEVKGALLSPRSVLLAVTEWQQGAFGIGQERRWAVSWVVTESDTGIGADIVQLPRELGWEVP